MDAVVVSAASRAAEEESAPRADHSQAIGRRILAIYNPAAGRSRKVKFDDTVSAVRDMGCSVTAVATTAPGHAETIAREAGDEFDAIAAGGGDGTINEVVNGLPGKSLALGIIPLGTANVLADEIGLARTTKAIARTLAQGSVREIRVGRLNGRRFVMMAGAGFDADVVAGVSLALKKKLGPLAYVWQAGRQAFGTKLPGCGVTIDGVPYAAASAVACNGRRYGGPFVAAPAASLGDDCFHVVLMRGDGWLDIARYGVCLVLGVIGKLPDVRIVPGREILVQGVAGRPVQADGDIVATLPARISVDPEPVRLIFPR